MGVFRLFLALSVMLGHTRGHGFLGLSFVFPEVAVQSFFIISGFYMALVLHEKYNQPGQYFTFLQQRFLRLYPTYFILIVTVLLVDLAMWKITGHAWGSLTVWADNFHLLSPLGAAFLVFENLILFGQDFIVLLGLDPAGNVQLFWHNDAVRPVSLSYFFLIGPSWSLAVEFSFYVLAPFLVRRAVRTQVIILAICFLLRAAMYELVPDDAYHWIYFLFPPNLYFFMAGSLSYAFYKRFQPELKAVTASKPWIFIPFAIIGLDYCRFPFTRELYLIWLPAVFLMVPLLFALTSQSRVDRLIGELSYPCYLIHLHVLDFTVPLFSSGPHQWLLGPVSFAITLTLSVLFYRFIETKTERFRENLYRKSRARDLQTRSTAPTALEPAAAGTS
jgi:peptidoglycan/LPS O-acetylase OafA/YrhL